MNRFRQLLLLALLGLITACSYNELPENLSLLTIENDGLVLQVETRAETYKGQALDQEYFVTAADLENFVKYRRSASKRSDLTVKEVKSYGFDSSQTLFYILNYDKGWEVISADKRIQPTLAHGDSGEFTMDSDNEAMKFWMNMIADGVLQMRLGNVESEVATTSAESKDSADEPTSDHTAFWDAISHTNTSRTRFEPLVPIPGPFDSLITITPTYKYYLPHLTETFTESTYYGPYIQTSWGQDDPWNQCCPHQGFEDFAWGFARAGCVPTAAGQVLYFLQQKYDIPFLSYEDVVYDYTINSAMASHYDIYDPDIFSFIGLTTGLWDQMATYFYERNGVVFTDGNSQYSAALLAYLGINMGVEYGINESVCDPMEISTLFEIYDIECSNDEYSISTILAQLKNNETPVIINAYPSMDEVGHTWIVDGCYDYFNTIRKYYILTDAVLDDNSLLSLNKEDATGFEDSVYSSAGDTFHMNWGWDGDSDGWYASSVDSWSPSLKPDLELYTSYAWIIYNFRLQ